MQSPEILQKFTNFLASEIQPTQQRINAAVTQITDVVHDVAFGAISQKPRTYISKGKKRKPHKAWYTKECMVTKKRLSRLASQMKMFPFDSNLQSRYRSLYYEFSTLIRKAAKS